MKGHLEIGAGNMGVFPDEPAAKAGYDAVMRQVEELVRENGGELLRGVPIVPVRLDPTGAVYMKQARIAKIAVAANRDGTLTNGPACAEIQKELVAAAEAAGAETGTCKFTCSLHLPR